MTVCNISSVDDLAILRRLTGQSGLYIEISSKLVVEKYIGMLARYLIWALEPGGEARLVFPKLANDPCYGRTAKWPLVVQQLGRWLRNEAILSVVDPTASSITVQRTLVRSVGRWGCGLVVSGAQAEFPLVRKWVDSILGQEGVVVGDVALCGPAASAEIYEDLNIRYLPFDDVKDIHGRFLVCRKKNHLMASLVGDKLLIAHARISLANNCLASIPDEFDLITPRVCLYTTDGLPYLDWNIYAVKHGQTIASGGPLSTGYKRDSWRDFYSFSIPYVDGGLFAISRVQFERTPMRDNAAWGEAEDVEWCSDITADSGLVELAENAVAVSSTNKMPRYERLAKNPIYRAYKWVRMKQFEIKFG